ncbi:MULTISPECIES: MaoC/PaaZ C-terminal domain-containing protein [unclassified Streptomyces]|uniref:MaoC/PaaZ C-terminal domain-containing protein n=1 Tax=unclassified Streptomyces TaxID=2593676 RepID=UPI002E2E2431|nr:MaoC/PaaZ C-terminal domain-containing protein [Streptomyces sp. NBC_01429]
MDPRKLLRREFAPVRQRYTARDRALYALSLGVGADPLDARQLAYVREEDGRVFPTMANVLGYPGFWAREEDTGIDWRRLLHVEQSMTLHAPLPPEGEVVGSTRVTGVVDKGVDKGALLYQERRIVEAGSGRLLAEVGQVSLLRGDGGCGSTRDAAAPAHRMPGRAPDAVHDLPTLPQAALLYRLNGDTNPVHSDPATARAAGFDRPILHGLCTFGVAVHALLAGALGWDDSGPHRLRVRFTAPVLPGETLRTESWTDGNVVSFRTTAVERGTVVLDAGRVDLI